MASVFAQSDKTLQIIYLTKDYTSEANSLSYEIKDLFDLAIKDPSLALIFYLPNSLSPQIVKVNLPGDNREDIEGVFDALMTRSETIIDPATDLNGLVHLFDEVPLVGENGEKNFNNVEFIFYVTPTFWNLRYNEQIIASMYFALDLGGQWADKYCSMSIFHCANDGLNPDEKQPFGIKNLCKNYKFYLMTYAN